jgi:hypothetical protein
MLFAGKWMELEIIIFSEMSQALKIKYQVLHSYVETKHKIIIIIIRYGHIKKTFWRGKPVLWESVGTERILGVNMIRIHFIYLPMYTYVEIA